MYLEAKSNIRAAGQQPPGWGQRQWEGELPKAPDSHGSFALWDGMSAWPSIWRLAPDVLFPRSLNLAATDVKLVAVNWNSRFSHSNWVQGPWQEMKQTTWFGLAVSLSHCLGLCLYTTNGAPSQTWGCLLRGRKVVTYLQEAPSLVISGMVVIHHSSHFQIRSLGFFSSASSPPRDARNVTGCTGTLSELVGSHTKVAIYSVYAIHCKWLWSMPCLIPGSRGCR